MFGSHDVTLLSTAFAAATRASESDKYEASARAEFRKIARLIWESKSDCKTVGNNYGRVPDDLAMMMNRPPERIRDLLKFLRTIKMMNYYNPRDPKTNAALMTRWRMTPYALNLYKYVMLDWGKK